MNTMTLDTHDAAVEAKKAGFTDPQVEFMVKIVRQAQAQPDASTLATKADLATLKSEIIVWNVSTMLAIAAFTATACFFVANFLKH